MAKTNSKWHYYKELGGYFKLDNGILLGLPAHIDGTYDESEVCEIDYWGLDDEDKKAILKIEKELETKE